MPKHVFTHHEPCTSPKCGSSDGMAVHEDGYAKCYVCNHFEYRDKSTIEAPRRNMTAGKAPPRVEGEPTPLRGISQKTMETMRYLVGEYSGQRAHLVAVPRSDGKGHAATKVRLPNKEFRLVGDTDDMGLIFQDRFTAGGKRLVITEGEFDALSIAEVQQCQWPVVSLPNGTNSVAKSFAANFKFINSFEEIVIWFDNDEPGRAAAEEAAALCETGKVKIVKTPGTFKDANDLLKAGEFKTINSCIWNAEAYTPARFVSLESLRDAVLAPPTPGKPWIFKELNDWTFGRRPGEVYAFGAGTGVGKTDFFTQQAAADIASGDKVAVFSFEQTPTETGKRLAGKYAGKRFHVPAAEAGWTKDDLSVAFDKLSGKGCFIYDHWGSADWETVAADITVLAHAGYKHFYIDHLTAFAAHAEDEKKMLEQTCADMATLANKLRVNFYIISHLSTPDGTPHEEGGRVFVKHFKGSRAIGFWMHFIFGFERNTQAEDLEVRSRAKMRCLKDRYTGQSTGNWLTMVYDAVTGLQSVDNDWKWPSDGKKGSDHGFKAQDNSNTDF